MRNAATGNASQPFAPKPFYVAAVTLQHTIGNAESYTGRIPATMQQRLPPTNVDSLRSSADLRQSAPQPWDMFVLGFQSSTGAASYAAWTNATQCPVPQPGANQRINCNYCNGCSQQQCLSWRCCWDPSPSNGEAQCYYGSPLPDPVQVTFAAAPGCYSVLDTFGNNASHRVCSDSKGNVNIGVTSGPQYLLP